MVEATVVADQWKVVEEKVVEEKLVEEKMALQMVLQMVAEDCRVMEETRETEHPLESHWELPLSRLVLELGREMEPPELLKPPIWDVPKHSASSQSCKNMFDPCQ